MHSCVLREAARGVAEYAPAKSEQEEVRRIRRQEDRGHDEVHPFADQRSVGVRTLAMRFRKVSRFRLNDGRKIELTGYSGRSAVKVPPPGEDAMRAPDELPAL